MKLFDASTPRTVAAPIAAIRRSAPLLCALGWLLAAFVAIAAGAQLAGFDVARSPGDAREQAALIRFHDREISSDGRPYSWSLPAAALLLYGFDGRPILLDLRLAAPRPPDLPPAVTRLTLPGHPPVDLPLGELWRDYHLLLPSNPAGDTAIMLHTPGFVPGGADTRELGVALQQVSATAPATAPLLPPWPRRLFLAALPLIGWLLLRRLGAPPPASAAAAGAGLLLVGWAAANPLPAGYLLPTLGWPWLSLATLLLLAAWPAIPGWFAALAHPLRRLAPLPLGLGLLLLFGGLLAMRLTAPWLPALLAAGGALLALSDPRFAPQFELAPPALPRRIEAVTLLLIILLALGLRLYELGRQPIGLWRDESRHGLLALRIWQDSTFRPIYVVEGADLPALYFYLAAPIVGMFGPEAWSVRLVSALAGALAPLALWWAARPLIGSRAALFGAALLAWASWSLSMSRWGFPATLDQLLVLLAVGLIWRALDQLAAGHRVGLGLAALAGFSAGLAAYAYHTGRTAPFILAIIVLARLGFSLSAWRRVLPALLTAAFTGLLVLAPLLAYMLADSAGYNRRVGSVIIFNSIETDIHSPLSLLFRNAGRYLGMWHLAGDPNGRHHAPGAPMLDPLSGGLLGLGLVIAGRLVRTAPAARVLLAWLAVALLPGLLSTDAPHAMRALGTLAPACMLAGLGLACLITPSVQRPGSRQFRLLLPTGILLLSLVFNSRLYFAQMRYDPRVYAEFDLVETAMGRIARAADADTLVYVPQAVARSDTLQFLTAGRSPLRLEPAATVRGPALVLLPADAPPEQIAVVQDVLGRQARELAAGPTDPDGRPILRIFAGPELESLP